IRNVVKLEKWLERIGFDDVIFYDKKLDMFSKKHQILSDCQEFVKDKIPCFIKAEDVFENVKKSVDEFVNYSDKLDIYILADKTQNDSEAYFKDLLSKDLIKKYVLFDEDAKENMFEEYLMINKETFSKYENFILTDTNIVLKSSKWIDELKKIVKYPEFFSASILPDGVDVSTLSTTERNFKHSTDIFSCLMFKPKGFFAVLRLLISKGSFFTRKEITNVCYESLRMCNAVSNDAVLEVLSDKTIVYDNIADKMTYAGYTEYSKDGENRVDEYDRIYYV
ncbi:MAG: hypothetical protein MJ229_05140, partial [bacterium]|nr:hypothetical protein [bacterium]